jgi:transcriptional regulator with XRE-family HTH domain
MLQHTRPVGDIIRDWRRHRRMSQLDLALDAEVSARHISFVETGRSRPSRDMLIRLSEQLQIPLSDRNTLLMAAGFAPVYSRTPLDDPSLDAARAAIDLVIKSHEPYPALAVDRYWNLVAANRAAFVLLQGVSPVLLESPVNVLRISLHPEGVAPRIINLPVWRKHLLNRLQRQIQSTADAKLVDLYHELESYPVDGEVSNGDHPFGEIALPLQIRTDLGVLSFISTITVFGAVHDITLDELAIESFYPADDTTASLLRAANQLED